MEKAIAQNMKYILSQLFDQCQDRKIHCDIVCLKKFNADERPMEPLWAQSAVLAAALGDEFLNNIQRAQHSELQQDQRDFIMVENGFNFIYDFVYNGEFFCNEACDEENRTHALSCINSMIENQIAKDVLTEALDEEVRIKNSVPALPAITVPLAVKEETIITENIKPLFAPTKRARSGKSKKVNIILDDREEEAEVDENLSFLFEDNDDDWQVENESPSSSRMKEKKTKRLKTDKKKLKNTTIKKEKDTVNYVGSCCKMNFRQYFPYSVHLLRKHSYPIAACCFCKDLMDIDTLFNHINDCQAVPIGEDNPLIECPSCNEKCRLDLYEKHVKDQIKLVINGEVRALHTLKTCLYFKCTFCVKSQAKDDGDKPSRLSTYLKLHAKRYHSNNPEGVERELCNECGAWILKINFDRHLQNHTQPENFYANSTEMVSCDICGKLIKKYRFTIHRRTHFEKYPCRFCKKVFNRRENRTVHERIHSGDKPYICDECGACLSQFVQLKVHYKNHLKVKQEKPDETVKPAITLTTVPDS